MAAKKTTDTFAKKSASQAAFEAVAAATGLTTPEAPAQDHTQTAAALAVSEKPKKTGRPPITDPSAKKSKRLPLMLRQETFERLKAAADAREIPVSQLVTTLIMDFLKDEGGR